MVKPNDQHQEDGADQRNRNGHDRNQHRTDRAQEKEDDHDNDEQGFGQRPEHFVDRVLDVSRRIVRNADLHPGRQFCLDAGNSRANLLDDFQRVGCRQDPDSHEGRGLAVEADFRVIVLGAEHDVSDVAESHDYAVVVLHHQLLEFFGGPQIGVGYQIDRHHRTLGGPERREIVVVRQSVVDSGGRNAERRHLVRLQPDPHRESAIAEDIGALHAADGAQFWLNDAGQVIGDLVLVEIGDENPIYIAAN